MGKKEQKDHSIAESDDKVEAVLHLLRKHSPLTLKQVGFTNTLASLHLIFPLVLTDFENKDLIFLDVVLVDKYCRRSSVTELVSVDS